MANTKIPVELSSTPGIVDNSNATAITIDSSENVQIGSNSFAAPRLQLYAATTGESQIFFGNDGTNGFKDGAIRYFHESHATTSDRRNMTFSTANTERMRINATGVGIGTSTVSDPLHIKATRAIIRLEPTAIGGTTFVMRNGVSGGSEGGLSFYDVTNSSTRLVIDSSGNLLVGKTGSSFASVGVELKPTEGLVATVNGSECAMLNRLTSDGNIIRFKKDGTDVGSIGSHAGIYTYIGTDDTALLFAGNIDAVMPFSPSASNYRDNAIDLGTSSYRFDDIYATNGTIQTSDRNEKQDIEALTDAETRVAVAAKGLLRKFRWKDAVAEKGDEARTHFGIIAQDLQDAFTAEGLDAGDYAMFISSTWTDDDGVEQTRLGVRYSELLAFIIAAI